MTTLKACLRAAKEALAAGRDAESVDWAKAGLEHDQRSYEALLLLGKACFRLGDYSQADVAYHRATGVNPGALPGWQGLVELYQGSGDVQKLADAAEKAVSILKQQHAQAGGGGTADALTRLIDYYRRLAGAQLALGRHQDARRSWADISSLGGGSQAIQLDALHGLVAVETAAMEVHVDAEAKRQVSRKKKVARQQEGPGDAPPGVAPAVPVDAEAVVRAVRMLWAASEQSLALETALNNVVSSTLSEPSDPRTAQAEDLLVKLLVLRVCAATGAGDESGALGLKVRLLRSCVVALERGCANSTLVETGLALLVDEDRSDSLLSAAIPDDGEGQLDGAKWRLLGRWADQLAAALPDCGALMLAGILARHHLNAPSEEDGELLERSLSLYGDCPSGWELLAERQLASGDDGATSAAVAERSAQCGLDAVLRIRSSLGLALTFAEMRLRLVQARALLAGQGRLVSAGSGDVVTPPAVDAAEELFNSVAEMVREREGEDFRFILSAALQGKAQVALLRGEWECAESLLREAVEVDSADGWALGELGWLAFTRHADLETAKQYLRAAIASQPSQFLHHVRMGKVKWAAGGSDRVESMKSFLAAGKLNRQSPEAFSCLGFYYYSVAGDGRRARKCFDQAVSLDPSNAPYGALWAKLLKEELGMPAAVTACEAVCERSPHAFWAWRERGFMEIEGGQWRIGKSCLQRALPGMKEDAATWEALGLAYQRLQMYSSASGAYSRALKIDPTRLFSLLQKGHAEKAQGKLEEAVEQYRSALEASPEHPVALVGLADGLFQRAREHIKLGDFPMAAVILEEAEGHAQRGAELLNDKSSAWKLLGDIQLMFSRVAVEVAVAEEERALIETPEGLQSLTAKLQAKRGAAAERAQEAHARAVRLHPADVSAWLALSGSSARAHTASLAPPISDLPEHPNLPSNSWFKASAAVVAAIAALHLNPRDASAWVALGTVAEEPGLQQHALVQALWLDRAHVSAWAALGGFFLRCGHKNLARKAFDCCRAIDPEAAKSWAGMALIFSTYTNEEARKEALSSAAYALRLNPLEGGHVLLGSLALQLGSLKSPEIHSTLEQGVLLEPADAALRNLVALSCESLNILDDALHHLRVASSALVLAGATATSAPEAHEAIAINAERVLCKIGRLSEEVKELGDLPASGDAEGTQPSP